MLDHLSRRDSHEVHEMQWHDGCGSLTGYAGKFHTDVAARSTLRGLRQYRGLTDPSSPDDATYSKSQTARDTLDLGEKGPSAGRSGIV